ncbi:unnamed protein product [Absidia cylindrospora]
MVSRLAIVVLLGLSALQGLTALPTKRGGQCTPFKGNFGKSSSWSPQEKKPNLYEDAENGLKFNLIRPESYTTKYDKNEKSNYNTAVGTGPTFAYDADVQYGRLTASIKAPSVGGAVTALIFKSTDGDEIDFELIASPDNTQTNYFWGKKVETGKNGKKHTGSISDDYHTYTIDWSPESIKWYIDGKQVREQTKENTKVNGQARYPTSPAQIQIGLWDGSKAAGTAAWAQGPIKWSDKEISAYVKDIIVECPY